MPALNCASAPDHESLIAQWAALWKVPQLSAFVRIRYSRRLRSAAGRCRPERGEIILNERALADHPDEFAPTLCHEAAHVAVWLRCGRRADPHGIEWRALMERAGFAADPTCALATPVRAPRRTQRYLHRCPECGYTHRDRSARIRWMCPACARQGRRIPLEVVGVCLTGEPPPV